MAVRASSRQAEAWTPARAIRGVRIWDVLSVCAGVAGLAAGFLAGRDGAPGGVPMGFVKR